MEIYKSLSSRPNDYAFSVDRPSMAVLPSQARQMAEGPTRSRRARLKVKEEKVICSRCPSGCVTTFLLIIFHVLSRTKCEM